MFVKAARGDAKKGGPGKEVALDRLIKPIFIITGILQVPVKSVFPGWQRKAQAAEVKNQTGTILLLDSHSSGI